MSTAEIRARAVLDNSDFQSKISGMGSSVKGLASAIGVAFSGAAILGFAKDLMNTADSLSNASDALGVGVENLQALRIAADEAGVGVQGMDDALGRIVKAQADAVSGNENLRNAFSALGLSISDIVGKSPDRVLEMIGRGYNEAGQSADATSAVFDILGRSSSRLMGLLRDLGTEGVDATRSRFMEIGLIVEEQTNEALARAEDRWTRFWHFLKVKGAEGVGFLEKGAIAAGALYEGIRSGNSMDEIRQSYWDEMQGTTFGEKSPAGKSPAAGSGKDLSSDEKFLKEYESKQKKAADDKARLGRAEEELLISQMSATERLVYFQQQLTELKQQDARTDVEKAEQLERHLELAREYNRAAGEVKRDREKDINDSVRKDEEIASINKRIEQGAERIDDTRPGEARTTAWQRIGGGVGGEVRNDIRIAERTLAIQEQMLKLFEEANALAKERSLDINYVQE